MQNKILACLSTVCMALLASASLQSASAAELTLIVTPVQSQERTRQIFTPLANYLAKVTGQTVVLETPLNFFTYWQEMRRDSGHHLVLDAAHITDFRIRHQGYKILAKLPNVVSFSLVTSEDNLVLDEDELIGKPVATVVSPSLPALMLAQIFPNPMRQPVIVDVDSAQAAVAKLRSGEVDAAVVPTPMLGAFPDLNVVLTSDQVPMLAMLASPVVDAGTAKKIRNALVMAQQSESGRAMLAATKLPAFEATTADVYSGYADLLDGVWGYEQIALTIEH